MQAKFKTALLAAILTSAFFTPAQADDNDEVKSKETVSLRFIDDALYGKLPTEKPHLFNSENANALFAKYCKPPEAPPPPPPPPPGTLSIIPAIIAAVAPKIINFAVDKLIGVFEAQAERAQASFGASTSTFLFYQQQKSGVRLNRPCFILERRAALSESTPATTTMALIGAFNFAEHGRDAAQISVLMSYYAMAKAQSSKNKIHTAVSMQVTSVWDDGKKVVAEKVADFDLLNVNVTLPARAVCDKNVCDPTAAKPTWMDLNEEISGSQTRGYGAFSNSPIFPRIPYTNAPLPSNKSYAEVGNVTLSVAVLESSDAGKLYAWLAKKARANQSKLEDALKNVIGIKEKDEGQS